MPLVYPSFVFCFFNLKQLPVAAAKGVDDFCETEHDANNNNRVELEKMVPKSITGNSRVILVRPQEHTFHIT